MIHVIMDERPFGIGDGLFDRLHLLGDFHAGLARLDHFDHGALVAVSTFQPGDQRRTGCMNRVSCHRNRISSLRG